MQQTTLTLLDSYCERAGNIGLFAEPLNTITNLLFMVAAVLAARTLLRQRHHSFAAAGDLWLLIVALFTIGIGSGLWHMVASKATMLADVLPITVFINIFLVSALRRLVGLSWPVALTYWSGYAAMTVAAQIFISANTLNGTVMYLPTYVALAALTTTIYIRDFRVGLDFIAVLFVWSISLIFRTVDIIACPMFPIGTHFLWHILNAWVIWRLLMLLMARAHRVL